MLKSTLRLFTSHYKVYLCNLKNYSVDVNQAIIPKYNVEEKILKVAIIGTPNSGKSTLINNIMDRKVCAASKKVHTTRTKSSAIFTEGNSQIIFLDTPGLVNQKEVRRFKLERAFSKDSKACLHEADIIGVIHDVSHAPTRDRLDLKIIYMLEDHKKKPSFLVLNKIDMLKSKRKLLDVTRTLTENSIKGELAPNCVPLKPDPNRNKGWPHFHDIFMVSALTGSGLTEIKDYLVEKSLPGKWLYPPNMWSDQSPENIVINTVKAKFLDFLQQEIPYQMQVEMEFFEVNQKGGINCVVLAKCKTDRIAQLVSGASDGRIRQITASVQADLQHTFQNFVRINIIVLGPPDEK